MYLIFGWVNGECWNELIELKPNSYFHNSAAVRGTLQEWRPSEAHGAARGRRVDTLTPWREMRRLTVGSSALVSWDTEVTDSVGDGSSLSPGSRAPPLIDGGEPLQDTAVSGMPPTHRQWRTPRAPVPSHNRLAGLKQSCFFFFVALVITFLAYAIPFNSAASLTLPCAPPVPNPGALPRPLPPQHVPASPRRRCAFVDALRGAVGACNSPAFECAQRLSAEEMLDWVSRIMPHE